MAGRKSQIGASLNLHLRRLPSKQRRAHVQSSLIDGSRKKQVVTPNCYSIVIIAIVIVIVIVIIVIIVIINVIYLETVM